MGGPKPVALAVRFWAKVKKTDKCWLWAAHTNNNGYGQIWVNEHGKKELAHRVAWFLATGRWPSKQVLHTCDTPRCVRHAHHYQGTDKQNHEDMKRRGRTTHGEGGADKQRAKTHCPKGHPYKGDNLEIYIYRGYKHRRCRACNKARYKAYYQSRKCAGDFP